MYVRVLLEKMKLEKGAPWVHVSTEQEWAGAEQLILFARLTSLTYPVVLPSLLPDSRPFIQRC